MFSNSMRILQRIQSYISTHETRDKIVLSHFPQIRKKKQIFLNALTSHKTPLFFVDKSIVLHRFQQLERSLKSRWEHSVIAYSFKTNYSVAKLGILHKAGAWAEVVSEYEYTLAKKLLYPGSKIIFNGPLKRDDDIVAAIKDKSLIQIDNHSELQRVLRISDSIKRIIPVGMRIHTSISEHVSRFGFDVDTEDASRVVETIQTSDYLKLIGLHMHIGSDIDNPLMYFHAAHAMAKFSQQIKELQYIDMGGGFPASGLSPYGRPKWNPHKVDVYMKEIVRGLRSVRNRHNPMLIVEPGRYLVDDATIFVTKIYDIKQQDQNQQLLVDGTSTVLPLLNYRPPIARLYTADLRPKFKNNVHTVVYGSTCREEDILFEKNFPTAATGDYIIFFCTGAYNQSMGSPFIIGEPKTIRI